MRLAIISFVFLVLPLALAHNHSHGDNAHDHSHDHSHGEPQQELSQLKRPATKYKPDEDLRVRMEKFPVLLSEVEGQKKSKKQVAEYGDKVIAVVQDIFENCNLEPKPDAALHPVLAVILVGAEKFKHGEYPEGKAKIQEALKTYGEFFDHKGWKI